MYKFDMEDVVAALMWQNKKKIINGGMLNTAYEKLYKANDGNFIIYDNSKRFWDCYDDWFMYIDNCIVLREEKSLEDVLDHFIGPLPLPILDLLYANCKINA